jgi:hypothetical protein
MLLLREVQSLVKNQSPWIDQDEMIERYKCTRPTLAAMERRGEIPTRVNAKWNRAEVIEFEAQLPNFSPKNRATRARA